MFVDWKSTIGIHNFVFEEVIIFIQTFLPKLFWHATDWNFEFVSAFITFYLKFQLLMFPCLPLLISYA